jgi:sec-independent protein translocase protein TatA
MLGGHWVFLVALLVLALIIFGPGRLPELGGAVGKAMREFRKATSEISSEVTSAAQHRPEPAPATKTSNEGEAASKSSTSEANTSNQ